MQIKDPKPEIARLEELALQVRDGEIKLPKFQRPFVWRPTDMLKLLDSIYKGYPIGSLLIWNSSQKLTSERSISGLKVNNNENSSFPTNYLLDGQQRLTTLCGSLFWDGVDDTSIWNIHFDLEKEEFVYPKDKNQIHNFPLNKLIKTSDFIKQCMKFEHLPQREEFFRVSERLLKSLKDYKIAVVKIGDMTIDEVAPIFERINSTGRKLTMVDLMMAATWSDGFDLNSEIKKIKDKCSEIGFIDINEPIILRSIAASAELGINKEDIQRLRAKSSSELSLATLNASDALLNALRFLKDKLDIHDFSYIPYAFQLTYLAEFFRLDPNPDEEKIDHLIRWFWFTSVTRYFGTSNTGQVSKDLIQIRNYAANKTTKLFADDQIDISQLLYDRFNLRNATSTTFALLLNNINPQKTIDGRFINGSHKLAKSNQYYVSFSPIDGDTEKLNISKIIYPYSDNIKAIILQQNELYDPIGHFINKECLDAIWANNRSIYLRSRSSIIAKSVEAITGCRTTYKLPTEISTESNFWLTDDE